MAFVGVRGKLFSRNGNVFCGFADLATWIAERLHVEALLDGEIACVDHDGRPLLRFSAAVSASSSRLTRCI